MSFAHKFSKAQSLARSGQIPDAIYIYLKLLARFPLNTKVKDELKQIALAARNPALHPPEQLMRNVMAKYRSGNLKQAFLEARALSQRFPQSFAILNIYGALAAELGLLSEAEEPLKKALTLDPTNSDICNNLGKVCIDQENLDEAIFYYQLALIFEPGLATAQINLGKAYTEKKLPQKARDCFLKAIESDRTAGAAYRYYSLIAEQKADDPIREKIAHLLQSDEISDFDKSELFFAFAKMCEDTGDIDPAFDALVKGGALKQKLFGYDRAQDEAAFSDSAALMRSLDAISLPKEDAFKGPKPIFVLGMPRSGTSLVEQIISAHSEVKAGGELPAANILSRKLFGPDAEPTVTGLNKFRANYLTHLFQISGVQSHVTDKMPQNFLHIGLIRKAIPESKIVHVKRDARATCWSNFKHYFLSRQMGFSFNLEDTVAYYRRYTEHMTDVENRFGEDIYELDYDLLCENPYEEIAKLFDYLELSVKEACFNPHENEYVARTASQLQVQRPIYKGSSNDWRKFESHVTEVFKPLHGIS